MVVIPVCAGILEILFLQREYLANNVVDEFKQIERVEPHQLIFANEGIKSREISQYLLVR